MPRGSAVYGSHHEEAELAALLHSRAEAEYEPGDRRGAELARLAGRIESRFPERRVFPFTILSAFIRCNSDETGE